MECHEFLEAESDALVDTRYWIYFVDKITAIIDLRCKDICPEIDRELCFFLNHFEKILSRKNARADKVTEDRKNNKILKDLQEKIWNKSKPHQSHGFKKKK